MELQQQQHAVLVAPTGGMGHLNPMLQLVKRLASEASLVMSLLVPQDKLQSAAAAGLPPRIRVLPFSCTIHLLECEQQSIQQLQEQIAALRPAATCLIADPFVRCAAQVASALRIPRVALWTGSSLAEAIFFHIPKLQEQGFIPLQGSGKEEPITFLPGIASLPSGRLPLVLHQPGPYIAALDEVIRAASTATCVLVNTVQELEEEMVAAQKSVFNKNYFPIGPLVPDVVGKSVISDETAHLLEWLDTVSPSSVLYIAFGSVKGPGHQQVQKIMAALQSCGQPYVWAINKNIVNQFPEGFYEDLKQKAMSGKQGLLVEWAPQAQVLNHTSVGGFLTHCGWNSTLEALSAGVPTLCWPCGAEQNLNSFLMSSCWKTGFEVVDGPDKAVEPEEIAILITRLMQDKTGQEMRSRCRAMKHIVENSWEAGGSSYKNSTTDAS